VKEKYFTNESVAQESRELVGVISNTRKQPVMSCDDAALVVLDMQEYFLNESSHAFIPSSLALISGIKHLQSNFLDKGLPVIHTRHVNSEKNAGQMKKWWKDVIKPDNSLSEITSSLSDSRAIVIEKSQYDAFYKTELESILKENRIKRIVVTGVMTHLCLETTVRSGFVRGYEMFAPVDGTATYNREFHVSTIRNLSHGFCAPTFMSDFNRFFTGGAS
jgi:isochorismate hydrolase